jgi:hypothetical protein
MGQLLHGSARRTAVLRRAIQQGQESIAKPAKRYDLNPKPWQNGRSGRMSKRPRWGRSSPAPPC